MPSKVCTTSRMNAVGALFGIKNLEILLIFTKVVLLMRGISQKTLFISKSHRSPAFSNISLIMFGRGIASWLWGKVVQQCLDQYCIENAAHRVRYQEKSLLPTGGRRKDFYESPEDYNGESQLISIPREDIEQLLMEHDRPDLLQFGTDEMVELCERLYLEIGLPELRAKSGWIVFRELIDTYTE